MEITLNVNINAPALVELLTKAMNVDSGKVNSIPPKPFLSSHKTTSPVVEGAGPATPPFIAKEMAEKEAAGQQAAPEPKRGKKAAPPAAATNAAPAAVTAAEGDLTLEVVRARLSDYSADKRYGMTGVFAILKEFGVDRITALPKEKYAEFKQQIDAALAAPVVDPLN